MTGGFSKVARLALQCAGGRGGLHHQLGVLLHHPVEMGYRVVDLVNAFHLFAGRNRYFAHDAGDAADAGSDLIHAFPGQMHVARAGGHAVGGRVDKRFDLFRRLGAAAGEVPLLPPR